MLRQRRGEKVERGAEVDRFKIEVILGFTLGLLMHRKQHFVFLSYWGKEDQLKSKRSNVVQSKSDFSQVL